MSTEYIVELRHSDLPQLQELLRANDLPDDDCLEQLGNICGIFNGDELIVAGGLEPAGPYALLRSVVVRENYRGQGLAWRLTTYLLQRAEIQDVSVVYLLTETAERYFESIGFRRVAREQVPVEIRNTRQFASLCPDTATCMCIGLPLPSMGPD